jgi:hypothetical protein
MSAPLMAYRSLEAPNDAQQGSFNYLKTFGIAAIPDCSQVLMQLRYFSHHSSSLAAIVRERTFMGLDAGSGGGVGVLTGRVRC